MDDPTCSNYMEVQSNLEAKTVLLFYFMNIKIFRELQNLANNHQFVVRNSSQQFTPNPMFKKLCLVESSWILANTLPFTLFQVIQSYLIYLLSLAQSFRFAVIFRNHAYIVTNLRHKFIASLDAYWYIDM